MGVPFCQTPNLDALGIEHCRETQSEHEENKNMTEERLKELVEKGGQDLGKLPGMMNKYNVNINLLLTCTSGRRIWNP